MTISNIETFENDISEEIKHKEASMGDIASASGQIGNTESTGTSTKNKLLIGVILLITLIILAGGGYILYNTILAKNTTTQPISIPEPTQQQNVSAALITISPRLAADVLPYIQKVEETPYGSILSITDYSALFAYMIRNETAVGADILASSNVRDDIATTSELLMFSDITRSNQNMRVASLGSSTVVYAFISETKLVFSTSTEGILSLRGAILQ